MYLKKKNSLPNQTPTPRELIFFSKIKKKPLHQFFRILFLFIFGKCAYYGNVCFFLNFTNIYNLPNKTSLTTYTNRILINYTYFFKQKKYC